ncbi:MAG: ribosome small subunit-dependent GTPase A [Firmicutes bacterium]|nr:ribosome small subunit-dependent GTPase A [Bacillota bacterium]MDH7496506.1 ribosome small subunit-dependent GTPase A [Bacillota bacterium]
MPEGRVTRAYAGHYYVDSGGKTVDCAVRGRLRKEGKEILVGDMVSFSVTGPDSGVIEGLLPRKSRLVRPPVANVDQAVIVMACADPDPDLELLDRMLVAVASAGLETVICFNKMDLVSDYASRKMAQPYRRAGYSVVRASARAGWGLRPLRKALAGKISVFSGPSGVGKSALLNALEPGLRLRCGETSAKTGRGRHTTRYSVLLEVRPGGYVADTPGFSRLELDLAGLRREALDDYFPELVARRNGCRFAGCLHHKEPGCAVRASVEAGEVSPSRYAHYVKFLEEIIEAERKGKLW